MPSVLNQPLNRQQPRNGRHKLILIWELNLCPRAVQVFQVSYPLSLRALPLFSCISEKLMGVEGEFIACFQLSDTQMELRG